MALLPVVDQGMVHILLVVDQGTVHILIVVVLVPAPGPLCLINGIKLRSEDVRKVWNINVGNVRKCSTLGISSLESQLRITLTLGETGREEQRNPLQRVSVHKEC